MSNPTAEDFIGSIAIVGMAGRFPGARNVEQFWHNLRDGVESLSFFTDAELEAAGVEPALLKHPAYVKAGMILDDIELFDASHFGFTPREAEITDPQQRLFLECAWEALESAGYDSERYEGAVGVYAGVGIGSYLLNLYTNREMMGPVLGVQAVIGNDKDYLSTRVSYKLNLRGPSVTVQTTCSTSLVAVHLACQSLLNYQCDMALAGGVKTDVPQKAGYMYQEGGILSPDGHCRAFDAEAKGTVGGNGVGIVVLKRLAEAVNDGDQIHAVIRGSAINNDGAMKIGYTAPSARGQSEVIAMAQAVAEVGPDTISYVETHGTGTMLGDPIEIEALNMAFQASTRRRRMSCAIGSVKTNIGHLDAAAGVAGLIKTVLALKHKQLPPSLNFTEPNPQIDFAGSPFYVNTGLAEWTNGTTARRAGVSSFGIGGTNAHVVLEEAPAIEASGASRPWQLLVLSGKTQGALERASANLLEHFKRSKETNLADAAYTLQVGRRAFSHRRAVLCRDVEMAVSALEGVGAGGRVADGHWEGGARPVAFMFTGQGAQYLNMCRGLYEAEAKFREEVDRCARLLKPQLGSDLRELLFPDDRQGEAARARLNETDITQPALFIVEYALAQLWMQWGVRPEAMIGHSIGEYVAACISGVFTLEEALRVVAVRGRLMRSAERGAMLAVMLTERELEEAIVGRRLSIAAVNGPRQCVVAGSVEDVEEMEKEFDARGVENKRLPVTRAFHSLMMERIAEAFAEQIKGIELKTPRIPYISNVTGGWITSEQATSAGYWGRQLRETVRFGDGLRELMKNEDRVLLEVGPGQTLSRLAKLQGEMSEKVIVVSSLGQEGDGRSDEERLLESLGQLWVAGVEVLWEGFYGANERRHRVELPTYPFERQRYWVERGGPGMEASASPQARPRRKPDMADWFYVPSWKRSAPPEAARLKEATGEKLSWLVFVDERGVGARLVGQLERAGQEVVGVREGEQFARLADNLYAIAPLRRDDYDALLAGLGAEHKRPHRIVNCWGLDAREQEETDDETAAGLREGERAFYSLLYMAQALGKQLIEQSFIEPGSMDGCRIEVVTSGVQEVTDEEKLSPGMALVLGPCKVIPREYPNITCRNIDVTLPEPGTSEEERLIAQLVAEFAAAAADSVVAYRRGHRWAQSFEAVRLEEPAGIPPARLRPNGVYLITGGRGGIGLEIAASLAESVRARLVLLGRTALPLREEWQQWLEGHDERDAVSRKIRKVLGLEEAGAEVMLLDADVSDETQMREVIERVKQRYGAIHGLVHAAGVPPHGLIQLKTPEMVARMMAPKVKGTRVLARLLKDEKLDFAVLFSSLRSLLGEPGGVDYSACNAFMDACALQSNPFGADTFTVAINWDGWRQVGMGVADALNAKPEEENELELTTAEGVNVFGRILSGSLRQVVVSLQDLQARIARHTSLKASAYLKELDRTHRPTHPRPELSSPFVAPDNDVERAIAEIWQELLGIERVGVNDNFFELGGDSILSIQIISKVKRAGLHLTPRQIFEHQTIAELASVAGTGGGLQAEQGLVTGTLPLTPIQHWFFEKGLTNPHHFNQAILLEVRGALNPALLEQSLRHLLRHHDALRLRFVESDGGWQQFNADTSEPTPMTYVDLSGLAEDDQGPAIERVAAAAQTGLHITDGPLMAVVLCDLGPQNPGRLLVVIHHLAIDNVSWRILLEDLQTVYEQLSRNEAVELGAKTTSYQQWAERLKEYAQSEAMHEEAAYWLMERRAAAARLPVDDPSGANTEESLQSVSVSLGAEETQALLQEVPAAYRTQINDALLMALVQAFAPWTGESALVVDMEGHGREALFDDVDLSRTVGWFTTIFPLFLEVDESAGPGESLKAIKEELRAVPNRGMDYGLLRYLNGDAAIKQSLREMPQPEVGFLYMGQLDQSLLTISLFGTARESSGPGLSPQAVRGHLIDVTGKIAGGQLRLDWFYSENVHRRQTIERIAESYIEALRALIVHCQSPEAGGYTPSDFSEADLSQEELDALIAELTLSDEQN